MPKQARRRMLAPAPAAASGGAWGATNALQQRCREACVASPAYSLPCQQVGVMPSHAKRASSQAWRREPASAAAPQQTARTLSTSSCSVTISSCPPADSLCTCSTSMPSLASASVMSSRTAAQHVSSTASFCDCVTPAHKGRAAWASQHRRCAVLLGGAVILLGCSHLNGLHPQGPRRRRVPQRAWRAHLALQRRARTSGSRARRRSGAACRRPAPGPGRAAAQTRPRS